MSPFDDTAKPHADHDLERIVLGAALTRAACRAGIEASMIADDFDEPAHGPIFEAIVEVSGAALAAAAVPPDDITRQVADVLRYRRLGSVTGGLDYLTDLANTAGTGAHLARDVKVLLGLASVRRIAAVARRIMAEALDPAVRPEELAARAAAAMDAAAPRPDTGPVTLADAIEGSMEALAERTERVAAGDSVAGVVPTGLRDLDDLFSGGLQPERLYVIAARPGMGKSALVGNRFVVEAAKAGLPTLFVSLEMPGREVSDRMLCAEARVAYERFQRCQLSPEDMRGVTGAASALYAAPIAFDAPPDGVRTLAQLRAIARRHKARHGLRLLALDYLQLVRLAAGARDRQEGVGEVSRGLKTLAKELGIPVVAVAALNRDSEKRGDRRPQLSDLRESGNIESDADVVAFLYRDEVYNKHSEDRGICEIIVRKNRGGRGDGATVRARFDGPSMRFDNLSEDDPGACAPGPGYRAGGRDWS